MVVIENPILNSPYSEPKNHFRFTNEGITDEVVPERRRSTYIIPIPKPKSKQKQLIGFDEVPQENPFVNEIRERLAKFRSSGYKGVTNTTRRLLEYWTSPERENKLFFCQIEALETLIYLTEVGDKTDLANEIRAKSQEYNGELYRLALKMATGTGKTVVMAMIIAWHTLNVYANRKTSKHLNRFLIVAPGITIRDRLRVLLPEESGNYYEMRDLVPPDMLLQLMDAKIKIVNFHQFRLRDTAEMSATTKEILLNGRDENSVENPFRETPNQMVDRVCKELKKSSGHSEILVINDEAHHCYRVKDGGTNQKLDKDERSEAKDQNEDARLWFRGLEYVQKRLGIRAIYDLSATPFYLRGSGYDEGAIFPWVVSDFALVDAIESGLVKIPRVPVSDNTASVDGPVSRFVWDNVRDALPKKQDDIQGEPTLPQELEASLLGLYDDYAKRYEHWEKNEKEYAMPPVMIVVCNNTTVSQLLYRYIAGWERQLANGNMIVESGKLDIFSNSAKGEWLDQLNTILVDSRQLESGDALSPDFKRLVKDELETFAKEYQRRNPGQEIGDTDILREVLNTVGKKGKLGANVRCVISVSMLSEGWDVNTVTHIMGVRAFSTQLLCEQVVGRGLRRMSYDVNEDGFFEPEYAEIYGVPFAFIPTSQTSLKDNVGRPTYYVEPLESRADSAISFPKIIGYRYESIDEIKADFDKARPVILSPDKVPTRTIMEGMAGQSNVHNFKGTGNRLQTLLYQIARKVVEQYCVADDGESEQVFQTWLFPDVLGVVREWYDRGNLVIKDGASLDMLEMGAIQNEVITSIVSMLQRSQGQEKITPIFADDAKEISTLTARPFETRKIVMETNHKCHFNLVVLDTNRWEQIVTQALEAMPEVVRYVKNYKIGFTIPYSLKGVSKTYIPDFVAVLNNDLQVIIEVTGEEYEGKAEKVATTRDLWIPAVNQCGEFGQWAFIEVRDPYRVEQQIRELLGEQTRLI